MMTSINSFYINFCVSLIAPCKNDNVRLIPAANNTPSLTPLSSGRLEICYMSQWATVCKEGFGTNDAVALCGELSFNSDGKG